MSGETTAFAFIDIAVTFSQGKRVKESGSRSGTLMACASLKLRVSPRCAAPTNKIAAILQSYQISTGCEEVFILLLLHTEASI